MAPDALVGRRTEFAAIDSFLARVANRGGALVLLGEAGIGKTTLLDATADTASRLDMQLLRAAGTEFEVDVSFAGLHQVLFPLRERFRDSWTAAGAVLDVALGFAVGPVPDRLVVANATLGVLHDAARAQPTLVVIDDLQWIDRPSATVLALVARRFDGSRVGFLGAIRTGEDSFFEHAGLPELEVLPLEHGAAGGLLDERFPSLEPRIREHVLVEARGNPLALLELPGSSIGARPVAASTSLSGPSPGRRLQALFTSRIASLPDNTGRLLVLAALDGSGDLRVLETAATAPEGLADLGPAEKAGLVSVDAASQLVTFRHPLIRTAVVAQATNEERRRAHRALAEALTGDPERRAWHLADATVSPDESIAQLLDDTAHRTLRRGDATGAVAALTRSSELTPDAADRGRRLAEAAYIGANVTGSLSDATSLLEAARHAALEGAGALYAATAAAYLLVNGDGDVDTAYRLLVRAIENECANTTVDWVALEGALHALQTLCYLGATTEMWAPFYEALAHFPTPVPPLLYLVSTVFADPCRASDDALTRIDAAIASLPDADPIESLLVSYTGVFVDRLPECRQALLRIVDDGRAGGVVALAIPALALLATSTILTGQWDEADAFADEGIEMAESHGFEHAAWFPRQTKAMLAAYRGDEETTRRLAGDMMRWATPRRARSVHSFWNMVLHVAALGEGDFETAYLRAATITPPGQFPPYVSTTVYTLNGFVEAALRTGRKAEATAHVRAMRDAKLANISSRLALVVGASEAMVAPSDRATALFEEALQLPDADRWPFDLARVQLAYGEHLRRSRAVADARAQLGAALANFDLLQATPWCARAEKELRATGVGTPVAAGGRGEGLTAQELEVASLAAAGRTNKQIGEQLFMSPRTVGAHLYRVFPKLGITSRAALRDALTTRGID